MTTPPTDPAIQKLEIQAQDTAQDGRWDETARLCREILALDPSRSDILYSLADMSLTANRFDEAIELLQSWQDVFPNESGILERLAHAHARSGRPEKAREILLKAIRLNPEAPAPRALLLKELLYSEDYSPEGFLEAAQEYGRRLPQRKFTSSSPKSAPPLRVGFLSAHFEPHPITVFFQPVLAALDSRLIETFCYHAGRSDDAHARAVRSKTRNWREASGLTDAELHEMIRKDRLHALIDLDGHCADRLGVFALRSAPVQASWIGFPGSSGLAEMDWLMAGRHELPPGAESGYAERLLRLPHGFAPYALLDDLPEPSPLPALNGQGVVFGCFNSLSKITPRTATLWGEILNRIPTARLFLKNPSLSEKTTRTRLLDLLERCGTDRARVMLSGYTTRLGHHKAYSLVDVALDPLAYSGATTTCEALSMGVPVITLPGKSYHQRHTLSFLHAAGLPEWAVESPEEYAQKAVDSANDLDGLARLRQTLRGRLRNSPLCDVTGFARHFERVLYELSGVPFPGSTRNLAPEEARPSATTAPSPLPDPAPTQWPAPCAGPLAELPNALCEMGAKLAAKGERRKAEGCFRQALAHDPVHVPARANLVQLMLAMNRAGEACQGDPRAEFDTHLANVNPGACPPGLARLLESLRMALQRLP